MLQFIVWVVYPYSVLFVFIMGLVWQYDYAIAGVNEKNIFKTTYSVRVLLNVLLVVIGTSFLFLNFFETIQPDRQLLINWTVSILTLRPDVNSITQSTLVTKIHLFTFLTMLLMLPFTSYIRYLVCPTTLLKIIKNKR
ncbi:hypothetical protein EJF36_06010 [Bacillus sp. HMF5848]|uniref:respiratory nitrate reductase subunit gamma n=1 Tax=Bacillus sp. HMF5848 TaxID=2495421 RepID=UPI000F773F1B|nr:respiratory nitrate reductase subunit gamma [Bacillus sp. HMF5848]RSK26448.1 hypothetical protein EJF36_06010 [Bacillus sp. HMF5848]